ncbi:hypothetical protein MICRO8M_90081 [Microbacterium sp. 8M]|uniref:hypothetical protein n=1 Tax=Microbacterium sp. 8M TaxID=2653153 RepID=UPI0012F39CFC|nr:hypothetical protein [Microbacterium sp. 8M]VXC31862.1 hypothetical protein MICRO8M_90081 [Microbacterium sp. 8M]
MAHKYPTRRSYRILSICFAVIAAVMLPFTMTGALPAWLGIAAFVFIVFWAAYGTYVWRATKPRAQVHQ